MEASWAHKGFAISISGAKFVAEFDGVKITKDSLAAVKKDIDQRLKKKAEEIPLNLPVVYWRRPTWQNNAKAKEGIARAVITGIRNTGSNRHHPHWELVGLTDDGWHPCDIMPDTPENAALIVEMRRLEVAQKALKEKINERTISLHSSDYATAVMELQQSFKTPKGKK